jgi:hypothetical protein
VVDPFRRTKRRCPVYDVELRVRALLRSQVVEFTKSTTLPFVPFSWLVLREDEDDEGLKVEEVAWDSATERFICHCLDDVDAAANFGDDTEGLKESYEARGWVVRDEGPVRGLFIYDEPA